MTGKTHTFTALATSLVLSDTIQNPISKVIFILSAGATAKLADIDIKIGIRHRGYTHSFIGVLVFSLVIIPLGINAFSMGLIWGYMCHLLTDAFTVSGIYPFYPNTKYRLRLGKFRTGKDDMVFCGIVAGLVVLYYYLKLKGV